MNSTTRSDPRSRFEGQHSECDHTRNTQELHDLVATKKEFIISGVLLPMLGYAPQSIAIMTSSPNSTESIRGKWARPSDDPARSLQLRFLYQYPSRGGKMRLRARFFGWGAESFAAIR